MKRKPRIHLISNVASRIIGLVAKQMVARFGGGYGFYFVPELLFDARSETLRVPRSHQGIRHAAWIYL